LTAISKQRGVDALFLLLVPAFNRLANSLRHRLQRRSKLHTANKLLAQELQARHEDAQGTSDTEMTNSHADIEPRALVAHHIEEVQRHHVGDGHDHHEERAGRDFEAAVEDTQVSADDGEGDQDLQDEERALAEGAEDGDEPTDAVEGEGGDGGNVAGAEEC